MIPFVFALAFSILISLGFIIPSLFPCYRWIEILTSDDFNAGAMKVPTFYSTKEGGQGIGYVFCIPAVGVVFGGIHCAGWSFSFPSRDEAILWRVSSGVLTGIAFLLPLLVSFIVNLFLSLSSRERLPFSRIIAVLTIILLLYVVSRLLLLIEAFITLRQLTPGMHALAKWTSFIPHI